MSTDRPDSLPGMIPRRLSTDEEVTDYRAKPFVITGASMPSDTQTTAPDPRAPATAPIAAPPPALGAAPLSDLECVTEIVRRALLTLPSSPEAAPLSQAERAFLMGASALLRDLANSIDQRLESTAESSTTTPARAPRGSRRRK